jgi:D-alanyl-D-alanine dipeptidase
MNQENLVFIDQYGLLGSNFYWVHRERLRLDDDDLISAGIANERVRVSLDIIPALQQADKKLQSHNYRLYIKEGYRPPGVYKLAYASRSKQFGREQTDRVMNMDEMPHANGDTVDVELWDPKINSEVPSRNKNDSVEALFVGFYKNKTDPTSQQYQTTQELIITTMLSVGFQLGKKNEYFHYFYRV